MAGHVQVKLKHSGKVQEIIDSNGAKARKRRQGPNGKITSLQTLTYVTVKSTDPSAQCWICFGGVWYRVC